MPLLIRLLGVEEFGLWSLLYCVLSIAGLAEAGLAVTTTVFLARDLAKEDQREVAQTLSICGGGVVLLAIVSGFGLGYGASLVFTSFPALSEDQKACGVRALHFGALVVAAQMVQQFLVGVAQAYGQYRMVGVFTGIQAIVSNVGLVAVAGLGEGVVSLMVWQSLTCLVMLGFYAGGSYRLVKGLGIRPQWSSAKAVAVGTYGMKVTLVSLGGALFSRCDGLIVGALLGTSVLGTYAAIMSMAGVINVLSGLAVQPLLPELGRLMARNDTSPSVIRDLLRQAMRNNAYLALGLGGCLFIIAPTALTIMIPTADSEAFEAFRIAIVIYALYSVNAAGYYVLFSINAVGISSSIHLAAGGVTLLLIASLAPTWGLQGAVLGNVGYELVWLLTFVGMRKLTLPMTVWMMWLGVPGAWFAIVILASVAAPHHGAWRGSVLLVSAVTFALIFIITQGYRTYR